MLAAILVMALLGSGSAVFATETEPVAETEPTVAEAEPAPTEPVVEETQPKPEPETYTVDTESEIYQRCLELSGELVYDQLLVYDATNDEILFMDTREGAKLYPASTTKLFSAYVALQHLQSDEVITAGKEL